MAGSSGWTRVMLASSGVALGEDPEPYRGGREWLEAQDPDTHFDRLAQLTAHPDVQVRIAVALRPRLQMGLLITLGHDLDPQVRTAVAGSPRVNRVVVEHLLADRDWRVVRALAHNEATPLDVVQVLASHRHEPVRRAAARRLRAHAVPAVVEPRA